MIKTNYTYTILMLIAILFAIFSPHKGETKPQLTFVKPIQAKEISEQKETIECNAECKVTFLTDEVKIVKELASSIVYACKEGADDPVHCIKYATAISVSESSGGRHCNGFNCFGINLRNFKPATLREAVDDWVRRYNKYWYKASGAEYFYGSNGKSPKSKYCMSEVSSGTK